MKAGNLYGAALLGVGALIPRGGRAVAGMLTIATAGGSWDVARVLWKSVGITCLPAVDDSTSSRGLRPVLG